MTAKAAASAKAAQADAPPLRLDADVWVSVDGENLAGRKRVALLAEIDRLGSITHAAKAVGLSYKGAWDAVQHMSNLAGAPLLDRVAGGKGGGHTHLTARGAQLIRSFRLIEQEHERFLARLNRKAKGLKQDYLLLERMDMKTSARNQFSGTVRKVQSGAVNDEVELDIIGGQRITATITRESTAELRLKVGDTAFALIKASSVILVTDLSDAKFSARNRMAGTVSRVTTGAVNSDVLIDLPGGGTAAAVVTNESVKALGLAVGKPATAMFKVSSVILAVRD